MADDAELIARAQAGEAEAFGDLYERYVGVIYRYIRARVTGKRDAEDLTEQVFFRAMKSLDNYEERGRPYSAFLYQVARNELVDYYRKGRAEEPYEVIERRADSSPTPDEVVETRERVDILKEALSQLPQDYQEVIRLRLLLSLPTATVADWLGRSEGAVRVLLHRALNAMRERVRTYDG